MSEENTPETSGVTRRRLAKGAAWSIPALAVASAAPANAASPPPCPNCAAPGPGTWTGTRNQTLNIGAFTLVAGINFSACSQSLFQPAVAFTSLSMRMTFDNGFTTVPSPLGVSAGVGIIPGIAAINATLPFVTLPDPAMQFRRLCVDYTMTYVGLGFSINCPQTLCWNITGNLVYVLGQGTGGGTVSPG